MLAFLLLFSGQLAATTYTVTSTADTGAGTLRQAITDANANAGADIIEFNIGGGGAQSITVSSNLPTITEALTVDGTTQPGYSGTPLITIGASWNGNIFNSSTSGSMVFTALNLGAVSPGGNGFIIQNASSATVTNCISTARAYGLYFQNCGSVSATGNDLSNSAFSGSSGYALYLHTISGSITATGNTFGGTTVSGIYLNAVSNKTISDASGDIQVGSQLKEMNVPIEVVSGSNITVTGLDLQKTTSGGYISFNGTTGITLTNNILRNRTYGCYIISCSNVSVTGNNFTDSGMPGGYAMYFNTITGALTATGNTFGGATVSGIYLNAVSNKTISASSGDIQVGNQLKEINVPIEVVGGSNITITGLDLQKTSAGGYININGTTGVTLTNNILRNRAFGFIMQSASNATITGNDFTDSGVSGGWAMYFNTITGSITATGNTFGGATTNGIYLNATSNKTISAASGDIQVGSQLKEMNIPIQVLGGSNITITGLDLQKTSAGGYINIDGTTGITLTNNLLRNRSYGFIMSNASGVTITGNDFTDSGVSGGWAIYFNNVSGTGMNVSGNTIGGATTQGVYMISMSNVTIAPASGQIQVGAQLKPLSTPLRIQGGSSITMTGLDLEKTGAAGSHIDITGTSGITVTNNILRNRLHGIVLQNCSNATVTGNDLTDSGVSGGYAVFLNTVSGTLDVSSNTFGGTTVNGLYMDAMSNRVISDGSVGGTNVVIPDGSIFKTMSGNSIYITGGSGNLVQDVDLENTGSRVGNGIVVINSSNFAASVNQIIKRGTGFSITGGGANLTCNNIKDNTNGIAFGGSGSSTVNNNAIWLNSTGISNGGQTVDATNNWWGSADGPGAGGNNGTSGTGITTSPFSTTVAGCVEGSGFPLTYTFTGSGNWSSSGNWDANGVPPTPLLPGNAIVINGSGTCTMDVNQTLNAGATLTVNASKTLTISGAFTLTNHGTMTVNGTLSKSSANSTLTNSATGGITVVNGGALNNDSGSFTNAGTLTTQSGGTFGNGSGSFTNSGTYNNGGSNYSTYGGFSNSGTITNTGTMTGSQYINIQNSGSWTNSAGGSMTMNGFYNSGTNALLTNNGNMSIGLSNSKTFVNNATFTVNYLGQANNSGATWTNSSGATFTVGAVPFSNAGTFNNDGTMTLNQNGNTGSTFANNGTFNCAGTLTLNSGSATNAATKTISLSGTLNLNSAFAFTNNGIINGGGTLNVAGGSLTNNGSISNLGLIGFTGNGTLTVASGSTFSTSNGSNTNITSGTLTVNSGATTTMGGQLDIFSGGTLNVNGAMTVSGLAFNNAGIIKGSGTITPTTALSNSGFLRPGNSPGTLSFSGDLNLGSGTYTAEVDGTSAGQFDVLAVSGTATIGASSKLQLIFSVPIVNGTTFDVLTAGTLSGSFAGGNISFSNTGTGNVTAVSVTYPGGNSVRVTATSLLPVELVRFTGKEVDGQVLLEWETASELNNEVFRIERSKDGLRWTDIGFVAGNGTSTETHNYSFLDEKPLPGVNYYRLRQSDFDSKEEFSKVISVDFRSLLDGAGLSVFPNPVHHGEFTLLLLDIFEEKVKVKLFSPTGQILLTATCGIGANPLNVSNLPTGIYTLRAGSWVEKILVINQ